MNTAQGPAIHTSATCTVYLATDIGGEKANRTAVRANLRERTRKDSLTSDQEHQLKIELMENKLVREADRVAIKVMTQLDQFNRELTVRGHAVSPNPEACWDVKDYTQEPDGTSMLDENYVVNVIRSHKVREYTRQTDQTHPHMHTRIHRSWRPV